MINRKLLLDVLNHFKFVFMANNYTSNSNYIYVNTSKSIMWAYTATISYIYTFDNTLKEFFKFSSSNIAIPAKEFFNLIRKIKQDEITIEEKNNILTVKFGKCVNKISLPDISPDYKSYVDPYQTYEKFPDISMQFKNYFKYDKMDKNCENILFENNVVVSSNRYMFVKHTLVEQLGTPFSIRWDILKHLIDHNFTEYHNDVSNSILQFRNENYVLSFTYNLEHTPQYEQYFNDIEEQLHYSNCIYFDKTDDIDHMDSFLINTNKLDQMFLVDINGSDFLTIKGVSYNQTHSSEQQIKILKYPAGEKENFLITCEHFKNMYKNYSMFAIFESILYCTDVDNNMELLIEIENK